MKTTYVFRDGEWVDKAKAAPLATSGAAPMVIGDSMDATRHPRTGEMFESKSRFREVNRRHGLIEVGNEWNAMTQRRPIPMEPAVHDVKRAYEKVFGG